MCGFAIAPGGCWGGPVFRPRPHCGAFPTPIKSGHGNLDGAVVGQKWGFFGPRDVKGFGVDLNGNGRYDRGSDGVIGFDFNRNGKVDRKEIERSREMLRAFGGSNDLNGDGKTNICEKMKAKSYRKRMQKMDTNRDGRLSTHELAAGGGKVLVDHDRNGRFSRNETYSPFNIPTPGFGRGRLDFVDPGFNHSQVHHGWSWSQPPCFGGHHHHHHHYHHC